MKDYSFFVVRSPLLVMIGFSLLVPGSGLSHSPSDMAKGVGSGEWYTNPSADNEQLTTNNGFTPANEYGQYRYMIEFAEPGLLRQVTRPSGERFDANTRSARQVQNTLRAQQAGYRQTIGHALDRMVEISHHYLATHSGMAVWLTPDEVERIAALPGVASVERERVYELSTHRGPWFIGADAIWDGTATPDGFGLRGEGMVLGLLDTGLHADHPSFADDPVCGHGQGSVPDKVLSVLDCSQTDENGLCNGPFPQDNAGHGTHVGGTAVGTFLNQTANPPPQPAGVPEDISGVAPCGHIRSYRVCPTNSCPQADIQAGMNNVLLHGDVDVVNFSISGGNDPWNDNDRRKLDLVDASVLVATSAGNTSLLPPLVPIGNVNHRAPWVLSVAATTHDGVGSGRLSITIPGDPSSEILNIRATRGSHSPPAPSLTGLPIRHFGGQDPDAEGCTPGEDGVPGDMPAFPENFFAGNAALIRSGTCSFTTKIANAYDAGAELVIIRGLFFTSPINTVGQPDIPAYHISTLTAGVEEELEALIINNPHGSAAIDFDVLEGDNVLGDFSLRGPTPSPLHNLTKPDIAAPGAGIYAAHPDGYEFLSGTSMASPHVAGAALLVRQAHPDWTVPEVVSALMMTASKRGHSGGLWVRSFDDWDWDDAGSGRVDLTRAALAGLVMHEAYANYLAADPDAGGDVRTVNTPSVRDMECTPSCSWTRTVRNTLEVPTSWTVGGESHILASFEITIEPENFDFTGDLSETQELTITANPLTNLTEDVAFGEVVLSEADGLSPEQHITVAISGTSMLVVNPDGVDVALEEGLSTSETLNLSNRLPPGVLGWAVTEAEAGCELPGWLSVNPDSGSLAAGGNEDVDAYLDASALAVGEYSAGICLESNDPVHPLRVVPVNLTVIPPWPSASISPAVLEFGLTAGDAGNGSLDIGNGGGDTGVGVLEWRLAIDETLPSGLPAGSDFEIEIDIPNFSVASFPNGGAPVALTHLSDIVSGVEIAGFSFAGTASGVSGTSTAASDTCLIVESPDGRNYAVGGYDGVIDGCGGRNIWDFQGPGNSGNDGFYKSVHGHVFTPSVNSPAGEWTLTFVHDWDNVNAAEITWSDVTVTLHTLLPACDDPENVGWLDVTPGDGVVPAGASEAVAVTVDSAGLSGGVHYAALCVASNDPDMPLMVVPVRLSVSGDSGGRIFSDRFENDD